MIICAFSGYSWNRNVEESYIIMRSKESHFFPTTTLFCLMKRKKSFFLSRKRCIIFFKKNTSTQYLTNPYTGIVTVKRANHINFLQPFQKSRQKRKIWTSSSSINLWSYMEKVDKKNFKRFFKKWKKNYSSTLNSNHL